MFKWIEPRKQKNNKANIFNKSNVERGDRVARVPPMRFTGLVNATCVMFVNSAHDVRRGSYIFRRNFSGSSS